MRTLIIGTFMIVFLASPIWGQTTDSNTGTFTDSRDGNTYKWVKIGYQIWMAENLRYETENGSWCWENIEDSCTTRGRLYNWEAATKAAPPGWHLPSDEEWKELEIALGLTKEQANQDGFRIDNDNTLAGKLKLVGVWRDEYDGKPIVVTNESGFSAVATGLYSNDEFSHEGYTGWWTRTDVDPSAWIRHIGFHDNTIGRVLNRKEFAFPVRCVNNQEDSSGSTRKK